MGTLFEQPPRYEAPNIMGRNPDHLHRIIADLREEHGYTVLEACEVLRLQMELEWHEYRRNDLDIKDEQLGDFGKLLKEIADNLDPQKLREKHDRRWDK